MDNKYISQKCTVVMPDGSYPATVVKFNNDVYDIKLDNKSYTLQVYKNMVEERLDKEYQQAEFYAC